MIRQCGKGGLVMDNTMNDDYKSYLEILKDPNYLKLYDYYSRETIFGILGVDRAENPHSSFLRWLLDVKSNHGMGSLPIRKFLSTVCLAVEKIYKNNIFGKDKDNLLGKIHGSDNVFEEIKYGRYEIINQFIVNEMSLKGKKNNKSNRADIFSVLHLKFDQKSKDKYLIILIENKVQSKENYDTGTKKWQTDKYVEDLKDIKGILEKIKENNKSEWISNKVNEKDVLKMFIFLNAFPTQKIKDEINDYENNQNKTTKKEALPSSDEFVTVNYQYLLDGMLEPLEQMAVGEVKKYLSDYIRCLGQSKIASKEIQTAETVNSQYPIMAVSTKEREAALSLWEKHHETMVLIFDSLVNSKRSDGFFLLHNGEIDYWESLLTIYGLIDKSKMTKDENVQSSKYGDSYTKLEEIFALNATSGRKHKYIFDNRTYESYTKRNVGLLCRDIIADYIEKVKSENTTDPEVGYNALNQIRRDILTWNLNWLREVILFDNEVKEIETTGRTKDHIGKYATDGIKDFAYNFFSYLGIELKKNKNNQNPSIAYDKDKLENELIDDPDLKYEIQVGNGKKAYIAKFWGSDDLKKLTDYLDKKSNQKYKYKEKLKQIY